MIRQPVAATLPMHGYHAISVIRIVMLAAVRSADANRAQVSEATDHQGTNRTVCYVSR